MRRIRTGEGRGGNGKITWTKGGEFRQQQVVEGDGQANGARGGRVNHSHVIKQELSVSDHVVIGHL